MKGICETRQEYKFSLYLITKYLKSSPTIGNYRRIFSRSALMFIHKHVIQQEEWYAFYNRTNLHHNKENSNTVLEGMNNAIKHFSSSIHPQMCMSNDHTTENLINNKIMLQKICILQYSFHNYILPTQTRRYKNIWKPTAGDIFLRKKKE